MPSSPVAVDTLRTLLETQPLAVVATRQGGQPYTSLVAFAVSGDLRRFCFVTRRATTKFRNLSESPQVSLLIDNRTHSVEDFTSGAAVTVLGRAAEVDGRRGSALLEGFLLKHPHLEAFARAPSTALCGVEVDRYILVTRFQHVVEMRVGDGSSSNPRGNRTKPPGGHRPDVGGG